MRTIISGRVTEDDLATAALIAGIETTSYVTNGRWEPPFSTLEVKVMPVDKKLGVFGEDARDYSLCQAADALILGHHNPHLLQVAQQYGLVVYRT